MARQIYHINPLVAPPVPAPAPLPPLAAGDAGWPATQPMPVTQPRAVTQPLALAPVHHHYYPPLPSSSHGANCGPLVLLCAVCVALLLIGSALVAPERVGALLERSGSDQQAPIAVASLTRPDASAPTAVGAETVLTLTAARAGDVLRVSIVNGTARDTSLTPDSWQITGADGTLYQVPDDWIATLAPGAQRVYEIAQAPTGALTIAVTPVGGVAAHAEVP